MKQRRYLGKWELGSIVFHLCTAKLFTRYPGTITEISGSAGWLSVLFSGIVFLALLFLALRFLPRKIEKTRPWQIYRGAVVIYWVFAAVFALRGGASLLREAAYPHSPDWFLMLFLLLGALGTALCGAKAVYRMHSLLVLPVGVILAVLMLFGLRNAEVYNLAPLFGGGRASVFVRGLSTLFLYLDIPFIALLLPQCRPETDVKKTVSVAAVLGVAVNVAVLLIALMGQPFEMDLRLGIPLYRPIKAGVALGSLYLTGVLVSTMLYLALALYLMGTSVKGVIKKCSKISTVLLCVLLCLTLSGCYDSREVEKTAYLIALGIDKGETADYRYTFQISNHLASGGGEDGEQEEGNQGVTHAVEEADSLYLALSNLRSRIGKEPELSHIKVVVFSKELAREGLAKPTELLLQERKIRPDTNLCLAESAQAFLFGVKPTLEQSTARYYALTFQRRFSPYAPVTELQEFVTDCHNSGRDPVLPIADDERIWGMGIFDGGEMVDEGDDQDAMAYKLLAGEAEGLTVKAGESVFLVKNRKKPKIKIESESIYIMPALKVTLLEGNAEDTAILNAMLEEKMTNFLRETAALSVDAIGIGNHARKYYLTQEDWTNADWKQQLKKASIFTKTGFTLGDMR